MKDNQSEHNMGEQIMGALSDALQSGDFNDLNRLVSQSVVNLKAKEQEHQQTQNGWQTSTQEHRQAQNGWRTSGQEARQTQNARQTREQERRQEQLRRQARQQERRQEQLRRQEQARQNAQMARRQANPYQSTQAVQAGAQMTGAL